MFGKSLGLSGVAALLFAGSAGAQVSPGPPPAPTPSALPVMADQTFLPGVDVLSVDGERLGVLAGVEAGPGGERMLHIRRDDGSVMTAPATVASRGERAIILAWTQAEFESPPTTVETAPPALY